MIHWKNSTTSKVFPKMYDNRQARMQIEEIWWFSWNLSLLNKINLALNFGVHGHLILQTTTAQKHPNTYQKFQSVERLHVKR